MPTAWLLGCASGANPFIERYFYDCVYSVRDYIGFCLGLTAILFWVVAQIPQWVRNYRTKSAEALSPWFLAQWLLGDTFNLLGCLLQGQQLPTTTYTAMYFVMADVFMMMQYIYYGALQRRKEKILQLQVHRRHHHRRHHHQHGSSRAQQSSTNAYERVAGYDSSTKDHGVYQRQPQQHQQQQQGQQHWQQHAAEQQCQMGMSDTHDSNQQHMQVQEQQQLPESLQLQEQQPRSGPGTQQCDSSSSSRQGSMEETAARELLLPQSCAAAARWQLPSKQGGLMLGGLHIGGYKSALAVGVLVTLGLVSLAVPAGTWRMYSVGDTVAAAGSQRAMQARELGWDGSSWHSMSESSSSSGSAMSAAAGAAELAKAVPISAASTPSLADPERDILFVVGTMLGYCSSVLYLCSRLSQIHKNYTRKSSEGLSLAMFMMAVCANLCTGTGIVMRTFTMQQFKEQLPWIVGSLGTISLDMVILWQSIRYGKKGSAGGAAPGAAAAPAGTAAAVYHRHQPRLVTQHVYQPHQQHYPGHVADGYLGAAAYYRSGAAAPAAVINIPTGRVVAHTGAASAALLSSSAPAAAGWGTLSHRQGQSSAAEARRQGQGDDGGDVDHAAPLLSAASQLARVVPSAV